MTMRKITGETVRTKTIVTSRDENVVKGKFKTVRYVVLECGHIKPRNVFKINRVPVKTHCEDCYKGNLVRKSSFAILASVMEIFSPYFFMEVI